MKALAVAILFLSFTFLVANVYALPMWHNAESWTVRTTSEHNAYSYMIHGPYFETGAVSANLINVTLSFNNQSPVAFSLSNGGYELVSSQHQAVALFWNLTTNYTASRQISFRNVFTDEVYLYVAGSTDILAAYSIGVTDFAGLTNATVEVDKNVLGINQIVERQPLDVVNSMTFYLIMYSQYTLKIVSDQGTFTWPLPADSTAAKNFVVTRDMVTQVSVGLNVTATALRINGTSASVYFLDNTHETTSVTTNIYISNTTGQFLFYTQTDSGYLQNFTVATLNSGTGYVAITNCTLGTWTNPLPAPPVATSIWGVSFAVFGDWALYARNALGMFIVLAFFSVGSWKDTEWFLAAGIIIAIVLTSIGFMTVPYVGATMGLVVVALMLIDKGKKELKYS